MNKRESRKFTKIALLEFLHVEGNLKYMVAFVLATIVTCLVNTRSIIWIQNGFNAFLKGDEIGMKGYFWVIVIAFTIMIPMTIITTKCRRMVYYKTSAKCRDKISNKILSLDHEDFSNIGQGKVFSIIENSNSLSNIGWNLIITLQAVIGMLVICFNLLLINPFLLIPTIIIYGITFLIISKQMSNLYKYDDMNVKLKKKYNDEVSKMVGGFNEVRINGTEIFHKRNIRGIRSNINKVVKCKTDCDANMDGSISTIYTLLTIITFGYCACMITRNSMSITVAVSLIYYSWRLIDPVCDLSMVFIDNSESLANYKRYYDFMHIRRDITSGDEEIPVFEDSIEFHDVCFNYKDSEEVLTNVNLKIKKGEHIGICGESGSGKSSFLKLIPRLYDPSTGYISIDGIDIRDLDLSSLRSRMGIVSQDTYIFNDTILNNITYGIDMWTMNDVVQSCIKAHIYDFISDLSEGFYTKVGENGLKLSGGQKQRIALARIFLRNPDIIILDEATASLDNESEKIIQDSLNIFKDKTIITVAHRLSTIKNSDRIIVISKGEIVEEGDHIQLMTHFDGLYRKMYTIQQFD